MSPVWFILIPQLLQEIIENYETLFLENQNHVKLLQKYSKL